MSILEIVIPTVLFIALVILRAEGMSCHIKHALIVLQDQFLFRRRTVQSSVQK